MISMNKKNTRKKISIPPTKFLNQKPFPLLLLCITAVFMVLSISSPFVYADGYPPYWDNSTGAVHWAPVNWPTTWIPYTSQSLPIKDARTADPSNGGTSPQNYANISSSCTDQSQPSVSWAYSPATSFLPETFFFRWKVEQIPNTYATGPSPGTYSNADPWNSAQWTVLIDINGDGFYDFAVNIDGSSGLPATPIDVIKSIYNTTKSQSIDYVNDPGVYYLFHNPTAFIENSSSKILNFRNSLNPTTDWPNGSAETVWDYGTTRSTNITYYTPTVCNEYVIDYQIPLAMLDATAYGGPQITPDTPFCMTFVTANSNTNPLQKDIAFTTSFLGDVNKCVPCGDLITANGGESIPQPTVDWVTAEGCGPTTLTAQVRDAINPDCQDTLASVRFYYYYDANANGLADDGGLWTAIVPDATVGSTPNIWSVSWDSTSLKNGQYLIGVEAEDDQGNMTWSHLTQAQLPGASPPNYTNPSPEPGVVYGTVINTCGLYAQVTKTVNPVSTTVGSAVEFTVTIDNRLSIPLTINSIVDQLPPNFTYESTTGGTLSGTCSTGSPPGSTETITWTCTPAASIVAGSTGTLIFTAIVPMVEGTYSNVAIAVTDEEGIITSDPVNIGVGLSRLTISKSASDYSVEPNDTVTYTITYSNDSPVNTTGVTITDTLPTGLNFVSASDGGTYNSGTRTITWNIGYLASLEGPYSVSFNVTVDKSASVKTVNTATIDSNETAPASSSANIFVNSPLNLNKSANKTLVYPAAASPNNQVIYTIDYQNTGASDLTGVTITDPIPAGFSYISHTDDAIFTGTANEVIGDGYGDDDGICELGEPCIVTWEALPDPPGTLVSGASGSLTLTVQANFPYTGDNYVVNTATVDSNEAPSVFDTALVGVVETGGVCETYFFHDETTNVGYDGVQKISDTVSPVPADTGAYVNVSAPPTSQPFLEALRFYNPPTLDDQTLSDTINTRIYIDRNEGLGITIRGQIFDYDPVTGNRILLGSYDQDFLGNQRGLHEFYITPSGTLIAGHRILWIFSVRSQHPSKSVPLQLQFDGTVPNLLSGTTPDTFANSHARLCASKPALVLTKDVDKKTALPGDSLQYTLDFANLGVDNATGAQIVDILPTGTTFVNATLNGSPVTPISISGQQYTFDVNSSDTAIVGQINGGESGVLVINVTIDNPLPDPGISSLTNTAELTSNETDPVNDAVTTNIGLSGNPDLTVFKSADKTLLIPGDTVTYTLTVVNTGSGTANNVTVTDVMPTDSYYTYVAGSITGGDSNDDSGAPTLTWDITSLSPGASETLSYQMQVALIGVPAGVNIKSNTATANEAITGPYTSNTVIVSITTNANLSSTKSVSLPAPHAETICASSCPSTIDYTLANTPVHTGKLNILVNGTQAGVDSGTGIIIGDNFKNSTIDYATGALHLEFITAPAPGDSISASYNAPAHPGDTLEYTITVRNTGADTATGVLVTDPIPVNSRYQNNTLVYEGSPQTDISGDDFAYFDAGNNRVVFAVGDLPVTGTRTMKFSVTIDEPLPDGTTTITNIATASASNIASKDGTAAFNIQATPVLSLHKNAPSLVPYPLTTVTFGGVGVTTITVANVQYISVGDVISVGGTASIVTAINTSTRVLTLETPVTAGPGTQVIPTIKFTLSYVNSGKADATNVIIRDTLQPGLSFLSAYSSPECSNVPPITCTIGTLSAGEGGSKIIYVRPTGLGTYNNFSQMLSNELDTFSSNTTTTIVGGIKVAKSTSTPTVINNPADGIDYATYAITLTNDSTTAVPIIGGVSVTDTLPAGFTYNNTISVTGGLCQFSPTAGSATPTWSNCSIPASSVTTITFRARLAATVGAGTYQNPVTATYSSPVIPFDEINTTAEDVTVTVPNDLKVTKVVQSLDSPCTPGVCQVQYLVTVTNVGTALENSVIVTDLLPSPALSYSSDTPSQGTYNSVTGIWNVGSLNPTPPGNEATLQITAIVNDFSTDIQNCASLTSSIPVDTNLANNTGCTDIIPTLVTLSDFRAYEENGKVVVEWSTSSEINTAGFYLFRLDESTGNYIQINRRLLPAILTSQQGGTYSLIDKGVLPGGSYTYVLMEIEGKGTKLTYGPFNVQVGGESAIGTVTASNTVNPDILNTCTSKKCTVKQRNAFPSIKSFRKDGILVVTNRDSGTNKQQQSDVGEDLFENYTRKSHGMSDKKKARIQELKKQRKTTAASKASSKGNTIKISVNEIGLYYLDAARISELLGLQQQEVTRLIKNNRLDMTNRGQSVAYLPVEDNSGIYFYGEGIDSIYTNENIYWIKQGSGLQMEHVKGKEPDPVESGTFTETLHFEEDKILLAMDPTDHWLWDYIVAGNPSYDTKTFNIQANGVADMSYPVSMTIGLQGFSNTNADPDHHVIISINGTTIGEDSWDGSTARTTVLTFDQGLLLDGINTVEVKGLLDTGAFYSVFYIDSFDLTYHRLYKAYDNKLLCKGEGNPVITAYGFTNPDILVFDITNPYRPTLIESTTIDGLAGNYSVSFVPASIDTIYLAVSSNVTITDLNAWADSYSNLSDKENNADYIVIAPEELADAAHTLSNYRQSQGLKTMVVLLEDIMDEFNHGISSPEAIRDFLSYAYQKWSKPPRYVVLAGEGTYDYKDNQGFGDNLIPPMMCYTPMGLFPSDNLLADVDGDHIPEMAVGRLPVLTPEDLQDVINKIIVYEGSARNRILMLADNPDGGGDYPADSDEIAALVQHGYSVVKIYLSDNQIDYTRKLLVDELNIGAFLFNYIGHAGYELLAHEGLLRISDLAALENFDKLPILTAMTCLVGQFALPGYDSLSEELVLKGDGGAVAVWAPAGLSYNFLSRILDEDFFKATFAGSDAVLGDVILKALQGYSTKGGSIYVMDIYNLLGDPALIMR